MTEIKITISSKTNKLFSSPKFSLNGRMISKDPTYRNGTEKHSLLKKMVK